MKFKEWKQLSNDCINPPEQIRKLSEYTLHDMSEGRQLDKALVYF